MWPQRYNHNKKKRKDFNIDSTEIDVKKSLKTIIIFQINIINKTFTKEILKNFKMAAENLSAFLFLFCTT